MQITLSCIYHPSWATFTKQGKITSESLVTAASCDHTESMFSCTSFTNQLLIIIIKAYKWRSKVIHVYIKCMAAVTDRVALLETCFSNSQALLSDFKLISNILTSPKRTNHNNNKFYLCTIFSADFFSNTWRLCVFVRVEFVGPSLKTVGAQCAVDSFNLVSVTCAGCHRSDRMLNHQHLPPYQALKIIWNNTKMLQN